MKSFVRIFCLLFSLKGSIAIAQQDSLQKGTITMYPLGVNVGTRLYTPIYSEFNYSLVDDLGAYASEGNKSLPEGNFLTGFELGFFTYGYNKWKFYTFNLGYYWRQHFSREMNVISLSPGFSYQFLTLKSKNDKPLLWLEGGLLISHTWSNHCIDRFNVAINDPLYLLDGQNLSFKSGNNTPGIITSKLASRQWSLRPQIAMQYRLNKTFTANVTVAYHVGIDERVDRLRLNWYDRGRDEDDDFLLREITRANVYSNGVQQNSITFDPNSFIFSLGVALHLVPY